MVRHYVLNKWKKFLGETSDIVNLGTVISTVAIITHIVFNQSAFNLKFCMNEKPNKTDKIEEEELNKEKVEVLRNKKKKYKRIYSKDGKAVLKNDFGDRGDKKMVSDKCECLSTCAISILRNVVEHNTSIDSMDGEGCDDSFIENNHSRTNIDEKSLRILSGLIENRSNIKCGKYLLPRVSGGDLEDSLDNIHKHNVSKSRINKFLRNQTTNNRLKKSRHNNRSSSGDIERIISTDKSIKNLIFNEEEPANVKLLGLDNKSGYVQIQISLPISTLHKQLQISTLPYENSDDETL
ncbi:hypothetical protein SNEBB_003180 [Seison nebaliae]|nr:hypothetical protein SNEBB_003180 [Seison nebaliae]